MDIALIDHLSVLSDAIRVRMLYILEGRELTVSEICDVMQLPQSTVSRHLKTLADGDWVASRRDGTHRLYTMPLDDVGSSARRLWDVVREQVQTSEDDRRLKHVLARKRSLSEAFFSSAAGQWDKLREELFGATSHLRTLVGLVDPDAVVGDLGCGTGRVTELLAPFAKRIVAVDASTEMLKAARANVGNRKNVDLRQGPLEKLPIETGELDIALMMLVLHHLPEPKRVLSEVARTVRSGGRLVILDMLPHDREEYRQTMGHVWLGISEKQLNQWLHATGFKNIRWHPLPPEAKSKGPSLFAATARRD